MEETVLIGGKPLIRDIVANALEKVTDTYQIGQFKGGDREQGSYIVLTYTGNYEKGEDELEVVVSKRVRFESSRPVRDRYTQESMDRIFGSDRSAEHTNEQIKIDATTLEAEITGVPNGFNLYWRNSDGSEKLYQNLANILDQFGVPKKAN